MLVRLFHISIRKMDERISKYYQRELTAEERLDLLRRAMADELLKKQFIRHHNLLALLSFVPQSGDAKLAADTRAAFLLERRRTGQRLSLFRWLRYAAVILCLIAGTWMAAGYYFSRDTAVEDVQSTLFVPAGQRMSLTLPDGTVVWLNAQSSLTWPAAFSGDERRVRIEGEAFLEVAKDRKRPFIVSSNGFDIKVLGTTFNIYNYPNAPYSRISLIEGNLQVFTQGEASGGTLLKPNEEATLRNGRVTITPIRHNDYFLWKDGIYSFENETLEQILEKLELYYDMSIEVKDPAMLQWRYTVKFRQRDGIDVILRLMQRIKKFSMEKDEENNRIYIRKVRMSNH
jgi:ferric-dicitrate binding protein FerR (iron transport regulator)